MNMRPTSSHLPSYFITCALVLTALVLSSCQIFQSADKRSTEKKLEELSCEGKSTCVVAYFSPSCPVCNRSKPVLNEIAEIVAAEPLLGLRVVVGGDAPAAIKRMGKNLTEELGYPVELDVSGSIGRGLKIKGFPTWALIDESNSVVGRTSGGAPPKNHSPRKIACTLLTERLGVLLQVDERCS